MTQDEAWNQHYTAYMAHMREHHKRPSKHYMEDRTLFNWFKHNKKVYLSGRMPFDRLILFRLLLSEAEQLRKINQYAYTHSEKYEEQS